MRIIWQKEFDFLLKNNLTNSELRRYEKSFELPISSFEDLRRASDVQLPLFLKAVECRCVYSFFVFRDESLRICEEVLKDATQYSKERISPEYRSALRKLSRKYTRRRKCHLNLRAIVCYCDEHLHQQ